MLLDADLSNLLDADAQPDGDVVFFHDVVTNEITRLDFSRTGGVDEADQGGTVRHAERKKRCAEGWDAVPRPIPPISHWDGMDGFRAAPPPAFSLKKLRPSPGFPASPSTVSSCLYSPPEETVAKLTLAPQAGVTSVTLLPRNDTPVLPFPVHPFLPRHPSDTQRAVYCLMCVRDCLRPVGKTEMSDVLGGLGAGTSICETSGSTLRSSTLAIVKVYKARPKYVLRKLCFALLPVSIQAFTAAHLAALPSPASSASTDYGTMKQTFIRTVLNIAVEDIPEVEEHVISVEQSILLLTRLLEHDPVHIRIPEDLRSKKVKERPELSSRKGR
jgi:hypothetical protein